LKGLYSYAYGSKTGKNLKVLGSIHFGLAHTTRGDWKLSTDYNIITTHLYRILYALKLFIRIVCRNFRGERRALRNGQQIIPRTSCIRSLAGYACTIPTSIVRLILYYYCATLYFQSFEYVARLRQKNYYYYNIIIDDVSRIRTR